MGQAFLMGQSGGGASSEDVAAAWFDSTLNAVLTGVNADQQGCKFANSLLLQAATSKGSLVGFDIASRIGTYCMVKNYRDANAEYVQLQFNGTQSWVSGAAAAFKCLLRLRLNGTSLVDVLDPDGTLLLSGVTDLEFQYGYYSGSGNSCSKMDMHIFDNYVGK